MPRKKTRVIGTQDYINSQGEIVEMQVIETEDKEIDSNFHKLFLRDFLHSLDIISNQKTKIAYWIIDNINANNQITYSYRQISEKTHVSYQTVASTIKALKDSDFLRQDGKILIINPDIVFKGSASRRMNVLHRYVNAESGNTDVDRDKRIKNLDSTIEKLQKQRDHLIKQVTESREKKIIAYQAEKEEPETSGVKGQAERDAVGQPLTS